MPTEKTHLIINHIPRCGGTSIRHALAMSCKDNDYFRDNHTYISTITHGDITLSDMPVLSKAIHEDTKLFFDHSKAYVIEDLFNLNPTNCYRILLVRDPLDRLLSHLIHFYQLDINKTTIETLTKTIKPIKYLTTHYLTEYKHSEKSIAEKAEIAQQELQLYDFVFVLEKQDLIKKFNSENPFGLHIPNLHINRSKYNNGKIDIDKQILDFLKQELHLEYSLLNKFYS